MMGNQQKAIRALEFLALLRCRVWIYRLILFLVDSVDQEFRQGTNCSAPICQTSELGDSGWRLESPKGLFSHMSCGWYWLLTWGFHSSPYGPYQMVSSHRLGWTSSQHGAWLPNTTILRELAFYNLALEVTQCHFWCILFKLVTKPWPVSREKKMEFTSLMKSEKVLKEDVGLKYCCWVPGMEKIITYLQLLDWLLTKVVWLQGWWLEFMSYNNCWVWPCLFRDSPNWFFFYCFSERKYKPTVESLLHVPCLAPVANLPQ